MAKIMVMGPLELLMDTLSLIQQLGIMQVDEEIESEVDDDTKVTVPRLIDKDSVLQHQLYEKLRKKVDELLYYLSPVDFPSVEKNPVIRIDKLISILPNHLDEVRKRKEIIGNLTREICEHEAYKVFLDAVGELEDRGIINDVQCLGVQLLKREDKENLEQFLEQEYRTKAAFESVESIEGKLLIGVVIVEKEEMESVQKALEERRISVFKSPDGLNDLPLSDQKKINRAKLEEKKKNLQNYQIQQENFTRQWYGAYHQTAAWIDSHLSLIKITAAIVKSRMCFFIYGWLPGKDFQVLEEKLYEKFNGKVIVEESELVERDFSRIPTALHNPAYFEPFELFTRLLPMPPYTSFDITPFIGIFFPVFFGMMLGDVGYGCILLITAIFLVRRFKDRKNVQDAGKILFISSLYTIVFGGLYGECFGTVGHAYFGMKPVLFNRHSSIVPMLCFAIAAGVVHVIIGLFLGFIVSLRRNLKKEALFKLVNIFVILSICTLVVSFFFSSMAHVQKPLLIIIAIVTPLVLLIGGLMAPLELLKNVGNIISYARIMAVGLTSVLLAFVANYMAGRMGSIWAGIIVAVILHIFNLLLGVFAPTIHSLRLHYVEFLSKFMEPGGKEFKPLGRNQ